MIKTKITGIFVILFIITAQFIFSQTGGDSPDAANAPVDETTLLITDTQNQTVTDGVTALNTFSVWDFVRMLLVLGGVLAFIYFIFFVLKKAGTAKIVSGSTINVLSSQNLESGRSLHLVEIGPQVFLIGSGEGSVRLISEISNKETLDTIKLEKSVLNEGNRTFTDTFLSMFKKNRDGEAGGVVGDSAFLKKQRERLKKM